MIIIYEQEWGGIAVIENEKKAIEYINDLSYDYSDDPNDERSLKIYDLGDDIIEMMKFYNLYIHKNVEVNSVLEMRFTDEEDRTLI